MKIEIKRAYDAPAAKDGYRVLVDRLWPRGVKKELLALDEWCKDVAPSAELRIWFGHEPEKFEEFAERYRAELEKSTAPRELLDRAKSQYRLTLIYAAKDAQINHAVVLHDYLKEL
jgi:uncharacterized protein YeaO (DUF488 family)